MADKKISELDALTGATVATDDQLVIVDTSAGLTKSITIDEFKNALDTATGFVRITGDTMTGDLNFGDNDKAIFGAGSDLQIYHDGTHSYIKDNGTGNLLIQGSAAIVLEDPDGNNMIYAEDGGPVYLYSNGSQKLATTSTGIDVTGTVTADGLTSSGDLSITGVATIGADAGGEANVLTLKGRTSDNDGYIKYTSSDGATSYAYAGVPSANTLAFYTNGFTKRLEIGSGGDISFYEDTGTTAKFFWDASAESLGIGTGSPSSKLHISQATDALTSGLQIRNAADTSSLFIYQDGLDTKYDTGTSGSQIFRTNSLDRMTLDSSGNVGIGVVPDAWSSTGAAIQLEGAGHLATANQYAYIGSNYYYNAGWKYTTSSTAAQYRQDSGSHQWLTAASGTADAALTWSQDMTLDASGNLIVGGTAEGAASSITLQHDGDIRGVLASGAGGDTLISAISGVSNGYQIVVDASNNQTYRWHNGGAQSMTLDASGNLLVGKTVQSIGTVGVTVVSGQVTATADGADAIRLNRKTSDGSIIDLRKDGTTVGSIGTDNSGDLFIGNDDTGVLFAGGSDFIIPWNPSTPAARDAAISLGGSSHRFKDLYLSGGVYLGGTGAANHLDDYEEGLHVTTVSADTGTPTVSSTEDSVSYTKIGNEVFINGQIGTNNCSGCSGAYYVTMPFVTETLAERSDYYFAFAHTNIDQDIAYLYLVQAGGGSSTFQINARMTDGTNNSNVATLLANAGNFDISIASMHYKTSS